MKSAVLLVAGAALLPVLAAAGMQSGSGASERKPTAEQLAAAHWVEGRVILPAGTPAGESITVVADATGLPSFERHASTAGDEGRFRAAFASDARGGWLRVESDHLFLERDVAWKPGEPATGVELRPMLGALLRGRVVLPADAQPSEREEVAAAVLLLEGTPRSPGLPAAGRSVSIAPDLAFELRALPAGYAWTAELSAGPFVPLVADVTGLEPGATRAIELVLTRGATVSGRVVDQDGAPVPGAAIGLVSHDDPLGPAPYDTRTVRTRDDGTFVVRGVAAGVATLWAARDGWISVDTPIPALAAGEARAGVDLLLRRGHVLSGRVLGPDGSPLSGVRVRVKQALLTKPEVVREVVTDASGAFEAHGLGDEPVDVTATWEPVPSIKAAPNAPQRPRVLRASAIAVDPRISDFVLQVLPGLVVEGRVLDDLGRLVQRYTIGARRVADEPGGPALEPEQSFRRLDVRDEGGMFVLEGLERGTWDVYAFGRGIVYEPAQRVRVPHEGEPLLFVVRRPAVVSGVVLDAQRRAVADALVEVHWERPPLYAGAPSQESTSVTCGRDGRFEITEVWPGDVRVTAKLDHGRAAAPVGLALSSGERKEGVELVLPDARSR